jgi:VHL beta domain
MELGVFAFLAVIFLGFTAAPFSSSHVETFSENSCSTTPFVSPQTHKPVMIKFHNVGTRPLKIDWVDFEGNIKNYGRVSAGGIFTQPTYAGHIWQVSDVTGVCKKRVVAKRGMNRVKVD